MARVRAQGRFPTEISAPAKLIPKGPGPDPLAVA